MVFFIGLLLAELMLILIFLITTLHIHIKAIRKGTNDLIKLRITAWYGLISLEHDFSVIKLAEDYSGFFYQADVETTTKTVDQVQSRFSVQDLQRMQKRLKQKLRQVLKLRIIIKKFMRQVGIDKLVWRSTIGSGEAAETGTITGIAWGIKASIIGVLSTYVTLRTIPRIAVQPLFNEKKLETEFEGIFRFRIGYAMLAGIRILLNFRKRRDSSWQNTLFKA